jgi:hypothetical protein
MGNFRIIRPDIQIISEYHPEYRPYLTELEEKLLSLLESEVKVS